MRVRDADGRAACAHIDREGQVALAVPFDRAERFRDGRARVRDGGFFGGVWGYVDRAGKVAVTPQFSAARDFAEGLAAVRVGGLSAGAGAS